MKHYFLFLVAFCTQIAFSQQYDVDVVNNSFENQNAGTWVVNKSHRSNEEIKGSAYLFEGFTQVGVVAITGGKEFKINNMNYNARLDRMEVQVSQDSIFSFDPYKISQVMLGSITFETFPNPEQSGEGFYEVVGSTKGAKLLKKYSINISEGAFNPMTQKKQTPDRYVLKYQYYLFSGDGKPEEIKLKKKSILRNFKEDKKAIEKFVKDNKLSYKEESDLQRIFNYHSELQQ